MELIWQYPELIGALIVAALLAVTLAKGRSEQNTLPTWLTEPACQLISILPGAYVGKLVSWLNLAGYRNNSAFGALCCLKVYPEFDFGVAVFCDATNDRSASDNHILLCRRYFAFIESEKRQKQIRESLPQALDLMVLCVDAGLGLDAAIRRIASERTAISSALNDELLTLGRDILLGVGRERAYQELYNRTGVEELKALTSALNQSAKLGLSIARILRSQAEFQRTRLSQKAEEKAAKLPIYMAFPLWFCVMPTLMVILLAPSIITFMQNLPMSISSGAVPGL